MASEKRRFWMAFAIAAATANTAPYTPRVLAMTLFAVAFVATLAMIVIFARIAARSRAGTDGTGEETG